MSMIDSHGRLFGKVNLVDGAIAVFVLVLIPLAYGTALMFRPATPRIDSVNQAEITTAERRIVYGGSLLAAKLKIKGTGFNPMLRAAIGDHPALAFVFENPNSADVLVGPLPPGAHDLVLFDGVQEVARASDAVAIDPPATRRIQVEGWLTNLDAATSDGLKAGATLPGSHVLVAVGPARPAQARVRLGDMDADTPIVDRVERPAVITLLCDPRVDAWTGQEPCTIAGQAVTGAPPLTLVMPGNLGLTIQDVFPPTPPRRARLVMRMTGGAIAGQVRVGDRDTLLDTRAALVRAARGPEVELELGLDDSREGWRYRGRLVTAGAAFTFSTPRYVAAGSIASVTLLPAEAPQ